MATPTPCLMLMLNHWIILIFISSECLASRAITRRAVRAINSITGPSYVSHYVKFWAVLGNEVKMMHFNHLNEPAKTRIRNSIQVHCNMQLVFGGHTLRKIFLWVNIPYRTSSKMSNLYFDFPHILQPTFHKVVMFWSGLTAVCAVRLARAEQLWAQFSVGFWLSLRTHVTRALRVIELL